MQKYLFSGTLPTTIEDKLLNSIKNDGVRWCSPSVILHRWRKFVFLWQKKQMTQKEAIVEALKRLGGRANLNDIYRFAYKLADFSGSKDWKATIRWYLQKETNFFRSTKRGWWELVSYQEDIANRDLRIKELVEENERLKAMPKEDDFVERFVEETKRFYKHERKKADAIRQIMIKVGRQDAEAEIDAWMDGKQTKVVKKVEKKIVQKISNSQVFNGSITNSEFNGGGTDHEG